MRVAEICAGYSGLFLGIKQVFPDAELSWYAENDPGASKILKYRYPEIPNYGDITKIRYPEVPAVDLLAAGFPCTDVSGAGRREGLIAGNRTGLWFEVKRAIDELQPESVLLENVLGLLSGRADCELEPCAGCLGDGGDDAVLLRALGAVLGGLAESGYDARWQTIPASAAGAPHRRERVFVFGTRSADAIFERLEIGQIESYGQECETALGICREPLALAGRQGL